MKAADIRRLYLDFFKGLRHKEIIPSPLVPENDPTTLFTSSGMQPLVPYLLGEKHPQGKRLVNSQRSFRAQDIEEIGDNRHTTFFEMLGNWSLGDYFKKEQLNWFFEFLTKKLNLDPRRLYITVFKGYGKIPKDNQSIEIWQEIFSKVGIEAKEGERILTYGVDKNWWSRSGIPNSMPTGEPGGPDSEVFYDLRTPHNDKFGNKCHPNCECGRFLEIGNSVFMQYQKQADGSFAELPQKNVDFGGGLERLTAASNNQPDIFKIDLIYPLIQKIELISKKTYQDARNKKAMRIISDHLRASVFMIADGVLPGNKTQGYILRRLIRRSIVYARELGINIKTNFVKELVSPIVIVYKDYYPYLSEKHNEIALVLEEESARFSKSLEIGLAEIEKTRHLDGKIAFKLYETYGFPWEMTEEFGKKRGETINREEFEKEFNKHRQLSRTTSGGMFKGGLADNSEQAKKLHTATHLLHAALRKVLGNHVSQKGSNITNERLRFDFSHPKKVTPDELKKIEDLVNEQIKKNLPVTFKIVTLNEAQNEGALAFFGKKYQEKVKVYTIGSDVMSGWFSKEVCGGPHVDFTSKLGHFTIKKEEKVSAGIRRIYAVI
ncbi:MAG: alanine--tRNA ligase [Patescibacteria group bacterium]|nr:alanine--tRNA ligase [Patescibacteria group bacterium]